MADALLEIGLETQTDDIAYWERIYAMHPSSVTVSRTSDDDFKSRQLVIWIDGEKIGDLMFGETFSRDVAPARKLGALQLRVPPSRAGSRFQCGTAP